MNKNKTPQQKATEFLNKHNIIDNEERTMWGRAIESFEIKADARKQSKSMLECWVPEGSYLWN